MAAPRRRPTARPAVDDVRAGRGLAFLLSQVGAHSSHQWNRRLRAAGLDSREVMLFWNIALHEGRSQRALAQALGLPASRVVGLVDALQGRGWVERKTDPSDRRSRLLYLTPKGRRQLERVMTVSSVHEAELTRGLEPEESAVLARLLAKVARAQGLAATVHPDF